MLHLKDWKGSAQGYRALTCLVAFLFLLTTACGHQQSNIDQLQDEDLEKEAISQLAIADTIIQYLHQHVAAIGFTDAAFL